MAPPSLNNSPAFYLPPGIVIAMPVAVELGEGWLRCNGAAVLRSQYAELFIAIGTAFGAGNGTTTFNLPLVANSFIAGRGGDWVIGMSVGAAEVALNTTHMPNHGHSGANSDSHIHSVSTDAGNSLHSHGVGTFTTMGNTGTFANMRPGGSVEALDGAAGAHIHSALTGGASNTHQHAIAGEGSSKPFNILNPNLAVRFWIKF